ncbi:hypothetical protein LAZ67_5003070, partial [Cordylochernes scorpioides]
MTAIQLSNELSSATGTRISRQTVYRRLHEGALYARRPMVCIPLTSAHRSARLNWCLEHHAWTHDQWANVLFSDESRFTLNTDYRRVFIWREPGTRYHPNAYPSTFFSGGTLTAQRYRDEILEPYLRPYRDQIGHNLIFMDDNARPHRARLVNEYLQSENIRRMDWPARSPDLNPIEHVWDALGRRIGARHPSPRTLVELRTALLEEWGLLPLDLLQSLKKSATEAHRMLEEVHGDHALSKSQCYRWFKKFQSGDFELDNEPRGKPHQKFEDADQQALLDEDSTQTQEKLAKQLQVSQGAVSLRLNSLRMTQKLSRWVPHELSERQQEQRLVTCEVLLARLEKNSFLHRIVTSDEKSIHFSNPMRQKSWGLLGQFPKQKPRPNCLGKKAMLCVWNVGATRVTLARVDRRILRQAVAAPQVTCTAILQHVQDTLDHSISTRTISCRLVANGLHSCRPLRRLPLTPPNRRQRLEWCRARSTWMTEWHRVVFSDESRFCLSSDSRRVRVWRRRGERSNPAAIVERPTVRQRGIMVWGAIAYDSRSPLLRIQGTMTAQRYVDDVLRPVTLPYLQGVPNALYQQDNTRPHTARISQQALQDVQMLPWPPYSPDLSPIEHVWDIIGRHLHALPQPRSEDELWQMVEREWRAIPQDAIRTLIDSLPRRVAACIAVRG